MKRTKSVTLIATGLILGLLPIWTVVEGETSRRNSGSAATTRAERAAERPQEAAEMAQKAMEAQREQLRQLRARRQQAELARQRTPRPAGSASGLAPTFYPSDRSLTVDGDIELGTYSNFSKNGQAWLWSDNTMNMGVGYKALAGTTGSSNTAVGSYALYSDSSGNYNTAMGAYALEGNEDGNSNSAFGSDALSNNASGSHNSAFGNYALLNNSTGSYNTAVGYAALKNNKDEYVGGDYEPGFGNTAVGALALYANTNGEVNVAVGYNALNANTNLSFLTAVGYNALKSNTSGGGYHGIGNTAIGSGSLESNTNGRFNTGTGYHALRQNVSGSYNTAVGWGALEMSSTQMQNSAFGMQALQNNYQGNANTAVGNEALKANTTGKENTAIGVRALNLSNGNYNIALGIEAGTAADIGDNNIFIGNFGIQYDYGTIRLGYAGLQTKTYVAGIAPVTLTGSDPAVCIDTTTDQLGKCAAAGPASSRRFKREIRDMGEASEKLSELRPVTFRFKEEFERGSPGLQFGLIAEEVAEVFPQLVEYDDEGKPYTVRYKLLTPLLLNELQRQLLLVQAQGEEIALLREQAQLLAHQDLELAFLRTRLDRLEAGHQLSSRPETTGHPTVSFTQSGREPPDAGGG